MVCPRCGTSVSASSGPCPACGTALPETPPKRTAPIPAFGDGSTRSDGDLTNPGVDSPTVLGDTGADPFADSPTILAPDSRPKAANGGDPAAPAPRRAAPEEGPLKPGQDFGARYRIMRLLGIGGMGAVYQAWDSELAVTVAIKVIRPEVMADPGAAAEIEKRFKRELLLARQVTHKNVVRIHDLGEIDGIKYITMPYVEGDDLATVLRKSGRLPIPRALRIARSIVAGLVEAHKRGVVHRDLKPANVMIGTDDEAVLMDFGIARSTGRPMAGPMPGGTTIANDLIRATEISADETMLGSVVGTVEYMAPEQAKGQHVDQRADIYAFGLIMYDMLIGKPRARQAGSAVAELKTRMEHAPTPVKTVVPEVPSALDALIGHCLEPDPEKRYPTSQDVAAALDHLDERGERMRTTRAIGLRESVGLLVLGAVLLAGVWWFSRSPAPEAEHDPISLVIADFNNQSGDTTFDETLEPALKIALEGAGFISAYDRAGIRRTLGVKPPDRLDEQAAREVAIKQGLGVVLSGTLTRQGSGYGVAVRATQAVTGDLIADASRRAASKDQVLGAVTTLAGAVRKALGDDTSDDKQRFAMDTLSATSLEVVREYAQAMNALSNSKPQEARQRFARAVALDPNFGLAYAGMAIASSNLGQQQEAVKNITEAVRHVDAMTERERYRTRGLFYYLTADYEACVKEYGDLIQRYSADAAARNNRALCLTKLRKMPEALSEMEQVVKILPKRALYHLNLAFYASYQGDFETAQVEARNTRELGSEWGLQALALAQTGAGQLADAAETYRSLGAIEDIGPSYTASGLGDLAIYEGRYRDAIRLLERGAAADIAANDPDRAASKFAALSYARLLARDQRGARAAAEQALANSKAVTIRFLAGRLLVGAGDTARAATVRDSLAAELQAEPQAYAKIIDGNIALDKRDPRGAIKSFTEANALLDTWIGRLELGRAYLEAGAFTQADSEFDRCIKRRGEALSLFLDEEPTYGYVPQVYYYLGQVREGLKSPGFAEWYKNYLQIRGGAGEDPLLPEVRRRVSQ